MYKYILKLTPDYVHIVSSLSLHVNYSIFILAYYRQWKILQCNVHHIAATFQNAYTSHRNTYFMSKPPVRARVLSENTETDRMLSSCSQTEFSDSKWKVCSSTDSDTPNTCTTPESSPIII